MKKLVILLLSAITLCSCNGSGESVSTGEKNEIIAIMKNYIDKTTNYANGQRIVKLVSCDITFLEELIDRKSYWLDYIVSTCAIKENTISTLEYKEYQSPAYYFYETKEYVPYIIL